MGVLDYTVEELNYYNCTLPYEDCCGAKIEAMRLANGDITEVPYLDRTKDLAKERKMTPVYSGVLKYFPDAIKEVAKCSMAGNEQHNPDKPLAWDREKSGDELDALARHLLDAGKLDIDGVRHSAKVAWRALANLQKEIENEK